MSSQKVHSAEYQVHYLGSSADLVALRRSMEARGAVSRSRLTPGITAVVADASVPLDHPTLVTARELGIDVLQPPQAMDRLLAAQVSRPRPAPPAAVSTPLITVTVLVLIGVIALLGFTGALTNSITPTQTTTLEQDIDQR